MSSFIAGCLVGLLAGVTLVVVFVVLWHDMRG